MPIFDDGVKGGSVASFYPYQINQSLRFNDDDGAYLIRTPTVEGDRRTYWFNLWLKPAGLSESATYKTIISTSYDSGFNQTGLWFLDNLLYFVEINGGIQAQYDITPKFRDPTSWYNIHCQVDTTQANASDRVKVYQNGELLATTISTSYAQNHQTQMNRSGLAHFIGAQRINGSYQRFADDYFAEFQFGDGTANLTDLSQFKNGVWIPKEYTGSYGTNGFHLDFADSGNIGNDVSGNNNDWTPVNLFASDVVLDSPTNNHCVFNLVSKASAYTLSDGNLRAISSAGDTSKSVHTTFQLTTGKWYWEVTVNSSGSGNIVGIVEAQQDNPDLRYVGQGPDAYGYYGFNGDVINNNLFISYGGASYTSGDVIGVALNMDDGELTFYKNGVSQGTIVGVTGTKVPAVGDASSSDGTDFVLNCGQVAFIHTPPTDHLAVNCSNLPEPVIGPNSETQAKDHFNTVLHTGTEAEQAVTGVGFQPDMVWNKGRNDAQSHKIFDAVRGATLSVWPDTTSTENTDAQSLKSFDADGFTLGTSLTVNNASAPLTNYTNWCWKMGGAGGINNDGTIQSNVSANTLAGQSIVAYTGDGGTTSTVGHGLEQPLDFVIQKGRTAGTFNNWPCYHSSLGINTAGYLNLNSAFFADAGFYPTAPTDSVIHLNGATNNNYLTNNQNTINYISYCFHEVDGYSKIGQFDANNNADGPFIYCGGTPMFIIGKYYSSGAGDWVMYDTVRDPDNPNTFYLRANSSGAEGDSIAIDIVANGFKVRHVTVGSSATLNPNGVGPGTVFYAVLEQPFKYANAK